MYRPLRQHNDVIVCKLRSELSRVRRGQSKTLASVGDLCRSGDETSEGGGGRWRINSDRCLDYESASSIACMSPRLSAGVCRRHGGAGRAGGVGGQAAEESCLTLGGG